MYRDTEFPFVVLESASNKIHIKSCGFLVYNSLFHLLSWFTLSILETMQECSISMGSSDTCVILNRITALLVV